jgi:hypothetical protein
MSRVIPVTLFVVTALLVSTGQTGQAQRGARGGGAPVGDVDFNPPIGTPTYDVGRGPRVAIDGGHNNFHTFEGGYQPFARLLARDGYRVSGRTGPFTDQSLRETDVLVIVSATGSRVAGADPSAFTGDEVAAVERWVRGGGALLLIADHEPWPLMASKLSSRFGVEYKNAYVYDGNLPGNLIVFRKAAGTIADHPVTSGVDAVATFLGSALRVTGPHVPLLRLTEAGVARPAIGYTRQDGEEPIGGWLQGALLEHGKGRVGVFAEAAMFTAQVRGRAMGMNAPEAAGNVRFLLNVMHWLARL